MDIDIKDKRVVVTAGAHGIGLAIADTFSRAGAQVHVCDVNDAFLAEATQRLPGVTQSRTDVADQEQVGAMFDTLEKRWGALDVLINNAGIAGPTAKIEETPIDEWAQTIAVNLTGTFLCARRAVPLIKAAGGGSIVNLSSAAGRLGFPLRSPYSASKFGIIGLTQTWAMELGPSGIRVNAILPGIVEGPRMDKVIRDRAAQLGIAHDEMQRRYLERVSLRRMVSPHDVAAMVVFLLSPMGENLSGQSLGVDGNVETL